MSVVDDAERIAHAKCRASGNDFDHLTSEAKERLLKEALNQIASQKDAN